MVNFVTRIQLEEVYDNIGNSYCTSSKCIFDANTSMTFPSTRTPLKIICSNRNENDINISFHGVSRAMRFVPKDGNKVKYKSLM